MDTPLSNQDNIHLGGLASRFTKTDLDCYLLSTSSLKRPKMQNFHFCFMAKLNKLNENQAVMNMSKKAAAYTFYKILNGSPIFKLSHNKLTTPIFSRVFSTVYVSRCVSR